MPCPCVMENRHQAFNIFIISFIQINNIDIVNSFTTNYYFIFIKTTKKAILRIESDLFLISHNWLILSKLYLRPSTNNTWCIDKDWGLLISLMPIIFSFALSPKVTCPPFLVSSLLNYSLSPVMYLEHPLSRYHLLFVIVDFKNTYIT